MRKCRRCRWEWKGTGRLRVIHRAATNVTATRLAVTGYKFSEINIATPLLTRILDRLVGEGTNSSDNAI